jgi:hypothetical protein
MQNNSDVVKELQTRYDLTDFEMSKALHINQSTLHRLKTGIFDSTQELKQHFQEKLAIYANTRRRSGHA